MEKLALSAEKKPNQTLPLKSHIEILCVFENGLLAASANWLFINEETSLEAEY